MGGGTKFFRWMHAVEENLCLKDVKMKKIEESQLIISEKKLDILV